MRGVTIQLLTRKMTGRDELNQPVYEDVPEDVENVLIAPVSGDDIIDATQLEGRKSVLTLGIPKGDTHEWENQKVALPAPFAGTYKVFGTPQVGIPALVPTAWNKKIMVEKYE